MRRRGVFARRLCRADFSLCPSRSWTSSKPRPTGCLRTVGEVSKIKLTRVGAIVDRPPERELKKPPLVHSFASLIGRWLALQPTGALSPRLFEKSLGGHAPPFSLPKQADVVKIALFHRKKSINGVQIPAFTPKKRSRGANLPFHPRKNASTGCLWRGGSFLFLPKMDRPSHQNRSILGKKRGFFYK